MPCSADSEHMKRNWGESVRCPELNTLWTSFSWVSWADLSSVLIWDGFVPGRLQSWGVTVLLLQSGSITGVSWCSSVWLGVAKSAGEKCLQKPRDPKLYMSKTCSDFLHWCLCWYEIQPDILSFSNRLTLYDIQSLPVAERRLCWVLCADRQCRTLAANELFSLFSTMNFNEPPGHREGFWWEEESVVSSTLWENTS